MRRFAMTFALTALVFGGIQQASAATYADWTATSADGGTGTFNGVGGVPDFTFTLTGDFDTTKTAIDDDDVFDNSSWEATFGEGDNQESLRFGAFVIGTLGDPLITPLTISFASPVNPSLLAFAVTDLELEDAVIGASLGGSPIPDATVAGWFQFLFDSKPGTGGSPHLPSGFDATNVAVVAEHDPDGLLSNEPVNPFGGNTANTESASAWFIPDTEFDTLTITHRYRGNVGSGSMHVYMAAVPEPSSLVGLLLGSGIGVGVWRRRRHAN
jgi:hypothetical protein